MINRGGEKINATEVEVLLAQHDGVESVCVVAMPDPRLGERACAFVVPRAGRALGLADLTGHLEGLGVAKFKWPEHLVCLEELPRTPVGKVDKKQLRRRVLEGAAREEGTAS